MKKLVKMARRMAEKVPIIEKDRDHVCSFCKQVN